MQTRPDQQCLFSISCINDLIVITRLFAEGFKKLTCWRKTDIGTSCKISSQGEYAFAEGDKWAIFVICNWTGEMIISILLILIWSDRKQ